MRGHLVQRGDRYDAVVDEGIDPATGKERHRGYPAEHDTPRSGEGARRPRQANARRRRPVAGADHVQRLPQTSGIESMAFALWTMWADRPCRRPALEHVFGTSNSDLRSQRPEHRHVGRDHAIGAVAVSLDDHLQVLVAEQVGDLAEGDVGVDHQRRNRVT